MTTNEDITKLKKTELIDIICNYEENKYQVLKIELGLPYDDDEEWVEYIKKLQNLNAERLNDCNALLKVVSGYKEYFSSSRI
tara:strand:+ start:447 stop:692 length:246 start_codon:yes stop_codon:yes gene_type:complete